MCEKKKNNTYKKCENDENDMHMHVMDMHARHTVRATLCACVERSMHRRADIIIIMIISQVN